MLDTCTSPLTGAVPSSNCKSCRMPFLQTYPHATLRWLVQDTGVNAGAVMHSSSMKMLAKCCDYWPGIGVVSQSPRIGNQGRCRDVQSTVSQGKHVARALPELPTKAAGPCPGCVSARLYTIYHASETRVA